MAKARRSRTSTREFTIRIETEDNGLPVLSSKQRVLIVCGGRETEICPFGSLGRELPMFIAYALGLVPLEEARSVVDAPGGVFDPDVYREEAARVRRELFRSARRVHDGYYPEAYDAKGNLIASEVAKERARRGGTLPA